MQTTNISIDRYFFSQLAWRPEDTLEAWGLRFLQVLQHNLPVLSATLYGHIEENRLERVAGYALRDEVMPQLGWGEGVSGEVARTQRPFLRTLEEVEPHPLGFLSVQPAAMWVFPWVYQGQTWAVSELMLWRLPTDEEGRWIEAEAPFLAMLASSVFQQHRIQRLLGELQLRNQLLEENLRRLEETQAELNQLNASLEQRIQERTRELQAAQQQLILSEKMAALGQLIAGVAHEINSPLGAIKGSAETLLDGLSPLWQLLQRFIQQAPETLAQTLDFVLGQLWTQERPVLTSKEERALRRRYIQALEAAGVADADTIARRLVEAGVYLEDLAPLLPLLKKDGIADFLYHAGQLKLQLENIILAANRTRKTVFALKSYMHTSEQGRPVPTRLEESVETILTLYQNQLKQGVAVHTDYAPNLPILYVFADELGQVWTNLIQNAIQAMQNQGEIFVSIKPQGDELVVTFTDTGPGIPPEIQAKIFEPFFTTKAKGEGTGLGLDISRRIVQKHGGRIWVESQPGRTSFFVALPMTLTHPNWYNHEPAAERV